MKTYLHLPNVQLDTLPELFAGDDVRYTPELVRAFIAEYTQPGEVVFDPFVGFGTTLQVAEEMGRQAIGLEYDQERWAYTRTRLQRPDSLLHGDARQLASYALPPIDFTMTSPPYMTRNDPENPFTAYQQPGQGYAAYLADLQAIYHQIGERMTERAKAVIEIANLKHDGQITPLAWDVAHAVGQVLRFEGEVVVTWEPTYAYGYDHSYCLIFSRP